MLELGTLQNDVLNEGSHDLGRNFVFGHCEPQNGKNDLEELPEVPESGPNVGLFLHFLQLFDPLSDYKLPIQLILLQILLPKLVFIHFLTAFQQLMIKFIGNPLLPVPKSPQEYLSRMRSCIFLTTIKASFS